MNPFDETIEKLKGEIALQIESLKANEAWMQLEKLYRALSTIEEVAGHSQTPLSQLFGFDRASGNITVKSGEFIGMDPVAAAKAYLDKKVQAASLDEIIEAIKKGGAQIPNRDDLRVSLGRSTRDVVKAPNQEIYRLKKHVPHSVTRGTKKSGPAEGPDSPTEDATSVVENGAQT